MRQSITDTYLWYNEHGYVRTDALAGLIARIGQWIG